ncbi:hypothetical protein GCM10027059_19470 [Myceligenerans halotolerans]
MPLLGSLATPATSRHQGLSKGTSGSSHPRRLMKRTPRRAYLAPDRTSRVELVQPPLYRECTSGADSPTTPGVIVTCADLQPRHTEQIKLALTASDDGRHCSRVDVDGATACQLDVVEP